MEILNWNWNTPGLESKKAASWLEHLIFNRLVGFLATASSKDQMRANCHDQEPEGKFFSVEYIHFNLMANKQRQTPSRKATVNKIQIHLRPARRCVNQVCWRGSTGGSSMGRMEGGTTKGCEHAPSGK